jgi:HEAT repeat protein
MSWLVSAAWSPPAQAYITAPVQTLGQLCGWSTYVTEVRVEKVSKEKGIIIYRKVRDLKGKYPRDTIRHVFDLKNTPAHQGSGAVPVRPDETDWKHAIQWAEPGKTAIVVALKYDPYGDFGHTYIDGLWYATMCPKRDWDLFYAIYSTPALLSRWHCGTPAQLIPAIEKVVAGKEAVTPVMVEGTREDLRKGKAKLKGLKVSVNIQDYNPQRDLVSTWLGKEMVPSLIKSLQDPNRGKRTDAVRDLGLIGAEARDAVPGLLAVLQDKDEELRVNALVALGQIGPEAKAALPAFRAALKEGNPLMRRSAIRAVGQLGAHAKAATPELTALLPMGEPLDRLEVAQALVRIEPNNQAVVPALAGLLKDPNVATRLRAVEILAQSGPQAKAAEPALIELLKETDVGLRFRVAEVLAQSGLAGEQVSTTLGGLFEDPKNGKETRLSAGGILAQVGAKAQPAVPILIKTMKDPDRDIRIKTAEVLAQVGPAAKAAIPVLAETVGNDTSGTVRMRAADALAQMGPDAKSVRPALKTALSDPRMAKRPEVLAKIMEVYDKLK